MIANLILGLEAILTLENFFWMTFGTIIGIFAGAIPGLSSTTACALLIPITFVMDPIPAFAMLAGIYNGGVYGGSISACLFNVPGAAASCVTAFDGYPMTLKGRSARALQLSVLGSAFGGIISVIALLLLAPPLARVVLVFGPAEYFWVAVFGISIVISLSSGSIYKGLIAALAGMFFAMVGLDPITAHPRFEMNLIWLDGGFQMSAVLLGMYSLPAAFSLLEKESLPLVDNYSDSGKEKVHLFSHFWPQIGNYIRSSVIGTVVGIIPAAGGNIASFISYDMAKKFSKNPEEFGQGSEEGIIASEAANNAVTGGSFIPLLTMGIPGSPTAAIIVGAFSIQGLVLGPTLFTKNAELTYALIWAMFITNIIMLFAGYYGSKIIRKSLSLKNEILVPLIICFSVLGAYSMRSNLFDVIAMLFFGLLGYIMKRFTYPASAFVLGFLLCPLAETNLNRTLQISGGNYSGLFSSWICWLLIGITLLSISFPFITSMIASKKR